MRVGDVVRDFTLPDQDGKQRSLSELLKGKRFLVVYFYPKDDTPGCTKEACGFRDHVDQIRKLGGDVVGISTDDIRSHQKFIKKYGLNFTLLSDEGGSVARAFNSFDEEKSRCIRKTFIINGEGKVISVFEKLSGEEHPIKVLEFLKGELGRL